MLFFNKNVSYAVDFSCTVAVLKFWLFIFNYHKIPILNKHPFKNNISNPLLSNLNLFFFAKYKSISPLQIFCTRNSFKDLRGKNSQLLTFSQISTFLKDKWMKSLSHTHLLEIFASHFCLISPTTKKFKILRVLKILSSKLQTFLFLKFKLPPLSQHTMFNILKFFI